MLCECACVCSYKHLSRRSVSLYKFSCITKDVQNLRLLTMQRHKSHTHTHTHTRTHTSDKHPTIEEERESERRIKRKKSSRQVKNKSNWRCLQVSKSSWRDSYLSALLHLLGKFRLGQASVPVWRGGRMFGGSSVNGADAARIVWHCVKRS